MSTVFRARAPLRLGFAGGGTDVSPYSDLYGGAVLNVTIGRYANATVIFHDEPVLRFAALDLGTQEELPLSSDLPLNGGLILHRAVYNVIISRFCDNKPQGMSIITQVESPMGSGLGSSSALVVAMIEAMREAFQLPLGEYDVAHLAYDVERNVAGLAGGRQDQFSATFGGVNFMEFHADDHVIVNPLRIQRRTWNELESSLVLCFTGISRVSAKIINDQSKSVSSGNDGSLEAMHQLKEYAVLMKNALLVGDIKKMANTLRQSWEAKKRTSSSISNSNLDEMYEAAMAKGAMAGKISGAGGGGFMFFFVDPVLRGDVMEELRKRGGDVSGCHMVAQGAESWRVNHT